MKTGSESKRLVAGIENNGMNASKFSVYSDAPIAVKLKRYGFLKRWWYNIPDIKRGSLIVPGEQARKENADEK